MMTVKPKNVQEYIDAAPQEAKEKLLELRATLKEAAPDAVEKLKWGIPVLEEKRILFSYAAYKSHLNFTPTKPSMEPFKEELKPFKTSQDTVHFPYDKPLPKTIIRKIAAYRVRDVRENDARWMY